MRMTLSEALKEDLVALDTCVYTLLPHRDLSGRQILYMEPHRHSRKGYTSESMVSKRMPNDLTCLSFVAHSFRYSFARFGTFLRLLLKRIPMCPMVLFKFVGSKIRHSLITT